MPFFAPTVMNAEISMTYIVLYGCCVSQGSEVIAWILNCMSKMVPAWPLKPCTVFSDDACPKNVVEKCLPKATHLLCAWHIIAWTFITVAKKVGG